MHAHSFWGISCHFVIQGKMYPDYHFPISCKDVNLFKFRSGRQWISRASPPQSQAALERLLERHLCGCHHRPAPNAASNAVGLLHCVNMRQGQLKQ